MFRASGFDGQETSCSASRDADGRSRKSRRKNRQHKSPDLNRRVHRDFDGEFLKRHPVCAPLPKERSMMAIPTDPETLLRRDPTAAALTEAGYQTSPKTLATLATRGGGPIFRKYGRYPVYRWGDALDWAHTRLSAPMRSTSDADSTMPHTVGLHCARARSPPPGDP